MFKREEADMLHQRWAGQATGLLLSTVLAAPVAWAADPGAWVGSWGASPVFPVGQELNGQTVRQYVRLSVGGTQVRVRFTNETGTEPLVIGAAHLARPGASPGSIDSASDHPMTFGGAASVTVPPGAPMLSDPIAMDAADLSTLAISFYVARWTGPSVIHWDGVQTAYLADGDNTASAALPSPKTSLERFYLGGVEVNSAGPVRGAIVAFGDSITDGYRSAIDGDHRWPDRLAERLAERGAGQALGVMNEGASGNRVLHDHPENLFGPSALARLDRDALAQPGLRWLIVMEGINDIGHPTAGGLAEQAVTTEQIIDGYKQIIARAHDKGVKVYGATLTPYEGTVFPGYFTPEGEIKRQAVNQWIRTGGAYDAVIDFDVVVRDPAHPSRIRPDYDVGDHLHPNDAGYKAMGDAVDLDLFK